MSNNVLTVKDGIPLHTVMEDEEFYQSLDAGIRFAVRVLHAHGIHTCQSCQGGVNHSYDHPTVDLVAADDDASGFIALGHLQSYGLPVASVSIHWAIRHGLPYEKLWRIEFWQSMEDRADEEMGLIYSYQFQPTPKNDAKGRALYEQEASLKQEHGPLPAEAGGARETRESAA